MNKEITIAEVLTSKRSSPYVEISKKYNTSYMYVYQIACGKRKPIRGKGLKIKQELEKLV